jgi:hypothetical protein
VQVGVVHRSEPKLTLSKLYFGTHACLTGIMRETENASWTRGYGSHRVNPASFWSGLS